MSASVRLGSAGLAPRLNLDRLVDLRERHRVAPHLHGRGFWRPGVTLQLPATMMPYAASYIPDALSTHGHIHADGSVPELEVRIVEIAGRKRIPFVSAEARAALKASSGWRAAC